MGDALSKPAEPWEDELPASPPAQQVPPADAAEEQPTPSDRRRVKVSSARLKPADAGGGTAAAAAADCLVAGQPEVQAAETPATESHEPAARQGAVAPTAVVGRKRKAVEPADGDSSESKRQQLLGLTILTLGFLQGLMPFAARQPAAATSAAAPADEHGMPTDTAPAAEPQQEPTFCAEDAAASLAAKAPAAAAAPPLPPGSATPQQDAGAGEQLAEAAVQSTPLQEVPLSAAKPVSRSQLRQQLQLRSQRASGTSSPAVRAAGRVVGTPGATHAAASTAAGGHSTRGQRLLGLVRQQQHPAAEPVAGQHAPATEDLQHGAQLLAEQQMIGEGMDVDAPASGAAAAAAVQQLPVGARQLAQRRLTQSPCRMAVPSMTGGSQELQATPEVPAQVAGGECTPPRQPPAAALPTPVIAEPGSAPRPGRAAAAAATAGPAPGQPSGSPLQAASAQEGDVDAALQQVGRLLVDLRDSPQPSWHRHGARAPEPAGPPEPEQARPEATLQLDGEVQSRQRPSPPPAEREQAIVAQPTSPQEVSSQQRLQEEGADNFPGFWRPPATGSPTAAGGTAGPRRRSSRKRAAPVQFVADARRQQQQAGQVQQPKADSVDATPLSGRKRRVRFSVPEEDQPNSAPAPSAQQPTPLVVAPPVLPSGRAGGSAARPGTPAKPAPLRIPQPPAFSRFGAAAFHRPYAGPQGRRQALMSFVSEGGANCFALPPVAPAEDEGGDSLLGSTSDAAVSPGRPAAGDAGGLVIPRRLQHRQGLGRRLSMQPDQPSLQGYELLAQEVREAFLNTRLADHAGEPWARLDVAGCELRPGSAHAEALAQLSSELEAQRGADAVNQLLGQLDAEWQHLKRLRLKYVGGPAPAAASPSPPRSQDVTASPAAAPGVGGSEEAARPRGILKHKSSLSGGGQASAAAAAAARTRAAQEQAAQSRAAAGAAPLAAAGFEAVLAADIVSEAPSAAPAPPAVPPSQPQRTDAAPQQPQQPGPDAMAVDGSAQPALQAPRGPQPAAAAPPAAEAPAAAAAAVPPAPADGAAAAGVPGEEAGLEPEPLSPRPVELTPGPSLSRGQKMLARLGTPVATGKLQLLAGMNVGRKAAGASPLFAGRPGSGGAALPQRQAGGRMSRGERLLAAAKGGSMAAPAAASPAPTAPAARELLKTAPPWHVLQQCFCETLCLDDV